MGENILEYRLWFISIFYINDCFTDYCYRWVLVLTFKSNEFLMIKYGLISDTDALTIELTLDLILSEFDSRVIYVSEIGLFNGDTSKGIMDYLKQKNRLYFYTGIDNEKDKPIDTSIPYNKLIIGNSNEVYNQLEDESQHFIFQDANHSLPCVISDFFCYADKVKIGGYMAFHDTAPQAQGKDWQRMGNENDLDMSISVLKALKKVGLLDNIWIGQLGWSLVFNEWDKNDKCGGIIVFKKIK
jgi:hypothetical protein